MARYGIRANVVSLGLVTQLARHISNDPETLERVIASAVTPREMEDVVPMVVLLASERASWITGQVISINGGYSMV
jgi:NAD(P)-dependent dehydrogenase (short-subunit alcohol dehydrogenase family)